MAFAATGLKMIAQGGAADAKVQRIYAYTTGDADSAVVADGYFDGILDNGLQVGDIIIASCNVDGTPTFRYYGVQVGGADVTVINCIIA
jgi:hypothetical protein